MESLYELIAPAFKYPDNVEQVEWFALRILMPPLAEPVVLDGPLLRGYELQGGSDGAQHSSNFAEWYARRYYPVQSLTRMLKAVRVSNWLCVRLVDHVALIPYVAQYKTNCVAFQLAGGRAHPADSEAFRLGRTQGEG